MNPTSQPSLTSRPIHQLLSYFSYKRERQKGRVVVGVVVLGDDQYGLQVYLNVEKIFDIERDRTPMHGGVVICCGIEADVRPDCKRNRLVL